MKKTEKKVDLRVVKTKQLIKESFVSLVEIKGYKRVSVKDIVSLAEINRNTFYLHYESKEDLVKELMVEASSNMNKALGTYRYFDSYSIKNISETQIRYGTRNLLRFIRPEIEFYRIVLLDDDLKGYINELYNMLRQHLTEFLKVHNPRSNIVFEYTFNGLIGIITQWIIYSPLSDAATAKILAKLAYANLKQFNETNFNM